MNPLTKNSRHTYRLILILFINCLYCFAGCTQTKIDYSIKSNILSPDTLKGDQKLIFDHFLNWNYKQVQEAEAVKIKVEFKKIGITIDENERFRNAYYFFKLEMTAHKKNVEDWEEFKTLDPRNKKTKKTEK